MLNIPQQNCQVHYKQLFMLKPFILHCVYSQTVLYVSTPVKSINEYNKYTTVYS